MNQKPSRKPNSIVRGPFAGEETVPNPVGGPDLLLSGAPERTRLNALNNSALDAGT